jgi:hypothetical protein
MEEKEQSYIDFDAVDQPIDHQTFIPSEEGLNQTNKHYD